MATRRYKVGGERVPSVTTVLGILAKPALINWAWRLGMAGEDYRKVRDDAMDIGTMTHALWELWLKGDDNPAAQLPPGDDCDKAIELFGRLQEYAESEGWTALEVEDCDGNRTCAEIALVSETYLYGGTPDCVVEDKHGRILLVDVKTSPRAYDEYWHQLAAYAQLLSESCDIDADAVVVICVPRDGGMVRVYECDDVAADWQVFLSSLAVYSWQKARKKVDYRERELGNGKTV